MDKSILDKVHKCCLEILEEIVGICEKNNLTYFLIAGTLLGAVRHKGFIPWDDDLDIAMPREDYDKFMNIYYKELGERFELSVHNHNKMHWLPIAKVRLKNTCYMEKETKKYKGNQGIWVDILPIDSISNFKLASLQKHLVVASRAEMSRRQSITNTASKSKTLIFRLMFLFFRNNKSIGNFQARIMKLQNKNKSNKYFVNFASRYKLEKQIHLKEKYFPIKKLEFEGGLYNVPNDYDYVLKMVYGDNYMELPPVENRVTHNPMKIVFEDNEEVIFDEKI